ncbi:ribose-phosphate diphosphokinase [Stetteria hydrogenophila]
MARTIVLGGGDEASNSFAASLARHSGLSYASVERKIFPDGESYVRVREPLDGVDRVVLVKTMAPPQDKSIIETLLLIDLLKEKGVGEVVLVAPYLAYARQDREFLPGESVSVRALLRALRRVGADALVTIEIHKEESLRYFEGRAVSVSPYAYMASRIRVEGDAVVLAPDQGALRRARELAEALGVGFDYLVKHRDRVTGEISIEPKSVDVRGKRVIIVDDVISTGGTVAKASELLLSQRAESVDVVVAHALMVGDAASKLRRAGVRAVYAANTLPPKDPGLVHYIDVAPLVAEKALEVP